MFGPFELNLKHGQFYKSPEWSVACHRFSQFNNYQSGIDQSPDSQVE